MRGDIGRYALIFNCKYDLGTPPLPSSRVERGHGGVGGNGGGVGQDPGQGLHMFPLGLVNVNGQASGKKGVP